MLFPKLCLVLCLVIAIISTTVFCQARRRNLRRPAPTKKSTGGRWIPVQKRIEIEQRRENVAVRQKQSSQSRLVSSGRIQFDNLIQRPLERSSNDGDLQEPSWSHCIHRITVDQSWARISTPNFPKPIAGQLQCTWMFDGIRGMRLQISFNELDLQGGSGDRCGNQFVDIIDLGVQKSQGRFCGDTVPGDYVTVGSRLRLDIQADTSVTQHSGFEAAVRSVPDIVVPGLRPRSTMHHGPSTLAPITTTKLVVRRPASTVRRTRTTTTTMSTTTKDRQSSDKYFGPYRQPFRAEIVTNGENENSFDTSIILYVFIALTCVFVVVGGVALVFRKQLHLKYKNHKKNKKNKKKEEQQAKKLSKKKEQQEKKETDKENERKDSKESGRENEAFSKGSQQIPQSNPATPSLDGRRRKSVVFEDEVLAGVVREPLHREQSGNDLVKPNESDLLNLHGSSSSFPNESIDMRYQGWNYSKGEPVYEDDALPETHFPPPHSISRNQEGPYFHQNFIANENIYAPLSEPIYHISGPIGPPNINNLPPPYGAIFQDPRGVYLPHQQLFSPNDSLTRGRPAMPPMYSRSRRGSNSSLAPSPIYEAYHQGKFSPTQKSQDDLNLHKLKQNDMGLEPSKIKPSQSLGDLSLAESEFENRLKTTQSMAELPFTSSAFPGKTLQRSQSFTM